jgi:hypothetical protein
MKLATLKSKLEIIAGTQIGEVLFDWKVYLDIKRTKKYPIIFWSLGGMKFKKDIRPNDIQNVDHSTVTVFAIINYNANTQDRIALWDTLEGYFYDYLNLLNSNGTLVIENIDNLNGEYIPEGMISADSEIGIMITGLVLRTYCTT